MKPRVFISSTYYDLKHVRERLERFIENYYFEPVLFESDNVLFEHGKELDESCYSEVELSHMMVLIVGGRYGSAVSDENSESDKTAYKKFTSITQKEFLTARKKNIPIFIFVEKNVHAEYKLYSKNKDFFDKKSEDGKKQNFNLFHVDDVNVHRFIDSLQSLPIKTFDKIEDIETYLGNQFAGMFYTYLENLREKQNDKEILDSVAELKTITKTMKPMIDALGENLLKDSSEYKKVIEQQNLVVSDFFIKSFFNDINFFQHFYTKDEINLIFDAIKNTFLTKKSYEFAKTESFEHQNEIATEILNDFDERTASIKVPSVIDTINIFSILDNYAKIYPTLVNNEKLQSSIELRIKARLRFTLPLDEDLPF